MRTKKQLRTKFAKCTIRPNSRTKQWISEKKCPSTFYNLHATDQTRKTRKTCFLFWVLMLETESLNFWNANIKITSYKLYETLESSVRTNYATTNITPFARYENNGVGEGGRLYTITIFLVALQDPNILTLPSYLWSQSVSSKTGRIAQNFSWGDWVHRGGCCAQHNIIEKFGWIWLENEQGYILWNGCWIIKHILTLLGTRVPYQGLPRVHTTHLL